MQVNTKSGHLSNQKAPNTNDLSKSRIQHQAEIKTLNPFHYLIQGSFHANLNQTYLMARRKNPTTTAAPESAPAGEINIIKQASALKLSPKNPGTIQYEIGQSPDSQSLFLRISDNDSGGYFSREWIAVSEIRAVLISLEEDRPFKSTVTRDLFQGGSSNNPGFLCAVLRAEGVLTPAPDSLYLHMKGHSVDDWVELLAPSSI